MLIEFTVGNYRSIKEQVTFSLVAGDLVTNEKLNHDHTYQVNPELKLLKSAAIYGANASGKSNLAKAMAFMKFFIINSSKATQIKELIPVESFRLSTATEHKPSFFEISFILDKKIYRYGFEINQKQIISEWLFYTPKIQEICLFKRSVKTTIKISKRLQADSSIKQLMRENALFLSVAAQFNVKIAVNILEWFDKFTIVSGLDDDSYLKYTINYLESKEAQEKIISMVKNLDLGISNIQIISRKITRDILPKELPKELKDMLIDRGSEMTSIKTVHQKFNQEEKPVALESFDLDKHESEGTRKIFALSGVLVDTLNKGQIFVIDELDARLHPLITRTIIELFHSPETNPHHAQLIFMTHDTNLLSPKLFRRDQIWFTEKNRYGATDLYSLAEYKIEEDAPFAKDYIQGKYGAIPFLGNFNEMIND